MDGNVNDKGATKNKKNRRSLNKNKSKTNKVVVMGANSAGLSSQKDSFESVVNDTKASIFFRSVICWVKSFGFRKHSDNCEFFEVSFLKVDKLSESFSRKISVLLEGFGIFTYIRKDCCGHLQQFWFCRIWSVYYFHLFLFFLSGGESSCMSQKSLE